MSSGPHDGSGPPIPILPRRTAAPRESGPNVDAVRLLLNGAAYLVLLCLLLLVGTVLELGAGQGFVEYGFVDNRDLVALFGWVGLTISGVSTIVVPGHVGVGLGFRWQPRLHMLLTNAGLVGFLVLSIVWPGSPISLVFLALAVFSFLLFGCSVLFALAPFSGPRTGAPPPGGSRR